MKILFITSQLPYPPKSGGVIKSWNLVKHWSQVFHVSVLSGLKGDDDLYVQEFKSKLPKNTIVEVFPLDRKRNGVNLILSYFCSPTLNMYRNKSRRVLKCAKDLISQHDIVVIDHYEMGQYCCVSGEKRPVILHTHNAEFLMWKKLADLSSNLLKKFILNIEWRRIKRAELQLIQKCNLVWAAPNDGQLLDLNTNSKFRVTYHLGEDEMLSLPEIKFEETREELLFIGTLTWEANIDGLIWFISKCWPDIKKQKPGLIFTVIGRKPDSRLQSMVAKYPDINLIGYVDCLEEYYRRSRIFIVPLRFGSGIKVKLINAMYRGLPAVSTSVGTEGIPLNNYQNVMCADSAEQIITSTVELLENKDLWERIRNNSRALARDNFTWKSLLLRHDKELLSLQDKVTKGLNL